MLPEAAAPDLQRGAQMAAEAWVQRAVQLVIVVRQPLCRAPTCIRAPDARWHE